MSLKKIALSIRKHKNFLITAHTNLEGDALGAELAFYFLIKKLGKKGVILNEDSVPCSYDFMPGIARVRKLDKSSRYIKFDCLAVLDCAEIKRTGEVHRLNTFKRTVINIDHHISNKGFGDVSWVDAQASSCSEMIYKIYKYMRLPIGRSEAIAMYTGMMTDTGSFRYSNTSSFTHQAVAELLKLDINVPLVYRKAYEDIPVEEIKILTGLLSRMEFTCAGKIAYFVLRRDMLKNNKLCIDLGDQLLSFARSVRGVEVVVLFKENFGAKKHEVRINLRSQGKVDVNKIASYFGGGGHKTAAGCTLSGNIKQIRCDVLSRIKRELK